MNNGTNDNQSHTQPPAATQALATVEDGDRVRRALALREQIGQDATPRAIVPRTFAEAQAFAGAIAHSSLVPDALRERAPDVLMIVLAGAELGIAPVRALSMFHVIEGVPKLSADALAAICMASPLCEYLEPREQSDGRVMWAGKRRDRPKELTLVVTQEDIERAGLMRPSRSGAPSNHAKYPRQMKNARAKAEICRLLWPEVCAGLLTAEEARDIVDTSEAGFSAPAAPAAPITSLGSPPASSPPGKSKAASKTKPIDATSTETKPATVASPTTSTAVTGSAASSSGSSPLPPDPAREAAFAKARGEEVAPPADNPTSTPAPSDSPATGTGSPSTATTSVEPSPTSSDDGPIATPESGDGFGDDEVPPARTFEAFELAVLAAVQARDPKKLDIVKGEWVPWSKDESATGGKAHAHKMREVFAKARADLGIR